MPSSNGDINGDGDGEEGVDVVGAKGINIVFQFVHVVTILNFWIWIWN